MSSDTRGADHLRIGLVLGAGGTAGGAFIRGAFDAIAEHSQWHPRAATTVVGTSIGALTGARLGPESQSDDIPTAARTLVDVARGWPELEAERGHRLVVLGRRLGGRVLAAVAPAGRTKATYPVGQPPYHQHLYTVAVTRRSGRRVVSRLVDQDDPTAWLYASAAVPMVNSPVAIGDDVFIDGAVHSTTNADLISPDDHDALVVIAPMVIRDGGTVVARSHRAQLVVELAPWYHSGKPAIVVLPSAADVADKHDHDAFARAGYASFVRLLGPRWPRPQSSSPPQLIAHRLRCGKMSETSVPM
ncbi:MAG: patatin-like phospholipase family protein [Acidimicrobiales bacterium]